MLVGAAAGFWRAARAGGGLSVFAYFVLVPVRASPPCQRPTYSLYFDCVDCAAPENMPPPLPPFLHNDQLVVVVCMAIDRLKTCVRGWTWR